MDFGESSSSQSATRVNQGPIDPSLLFRQRNHRSWYLYTNQMKLEDVLDCNRMETAIWKWIHAASNETKRYIELYGFGPVSRIGSILYDHSLITAMIERWRPETHTFHLPVGEATITLQDVEVLLGLKVDGEAITGYTGNTRTEALIPICQELLGFTPTERQITSGSLHFTAIKDHIVSVRVRDNDPAVMHEQRARCFIMWLLGALLLVDSTRNRVPVYLLQFLVTPETSLRYSWGSAVLASLYKNMCCAALDKSDDIYGCLLLIQVWAWERISTVRPAILADNHALPPPLGCPLAYRWRGPKKIGNVTTHNVRGYRDQLAVLQDHEFFWRPYDAFLPFLCDSCTAGRRIWRARTWLVNFEKIEAHLPDRVMRQFGFPQLIPENPPIMDLDRHSKMHNAKKTGRSNVNWANEHHVYNALWINRAETVVDGVVTEDEDTLSLLSQQYKQWYRGITILTITDPSTIRSTPLDGFQGSAESSSVMAQIVEQICRLSIDRRDMHTVPGTVVYDDFSEIHELAKKALELVGTTQVVPNSGDPSQIFAPYDPSQSQSNRSDSRPRHLPRGGPRHGGFRGHAQHPEHFVEEEEEDQDGDDPEHFVEEDEDQDGGGGGGGGGGGSGGGGGGSGSGSGGSGGGGGGGGSGSGGGGGGGGDDQEHTPSPCVAIRRGRREPQPRHFFGDTDSAPKKTRWLPWKKK